MAYLPVFSPPYPTRTLMYKPLNTTCPDCRSGMEPGFAMDQSNSGRSPVLWVNGEPEKSVWTGLKLKGRQQWYTTALRCPMCGFVRLYARERKK